MGPSTAAPNKASSQPATSVPQPPSKAVGPASPAAAARGINSGPRPSPEVQAMPTARDTAPAMTPAMAPPPSTTPTDWRERRGRRLAERAIGLHRRSRLSQSEGQRAVHLDQRQT